jgi:hypothetical protein
MATSKKYMCVPGKDKEICIYYMFSTLVMKQDVTIHTSICRRNSNSIVSNSKHEEWRLWYRRQCDVIHSGDDVEWMWEQNTICPEFHQCAGTSDIQQGFNANKGVSGDLFSLVTFWDLFFSFVTFRDLMFSLVTF